MNILALETTGKYASVCLLNDMGAFKKVSLEEMNHLQGLLTMAEELLVKCKLQIDDVDAIAVSIGPGSFTGMRIGIATARAISEAKGIKCIAVKTLESFEFSESENSAEANIFVPMLDARRGQVYSALYIKGKDALSKEEFATDIYMIDELLEKIARFAREEFESGELCIFFTGDASIKYRQKIEDWAQAYGEEYAKLPIESKQCASIKAVFERDEDVHQNAKRVAKRAYFSYLNGEFTSFSDIKPMYLRGAEAERKLQKEKHDELENAIDKISI